MVFQMKKNMKSKLNAKIKNTIRWRNKLCNKINIFRYWKIIKINISGYIECLMQNRDGITIFSLKQNEKEDIINYIIAN